VPCGRRELLAGTVAIGLSGMARGPFRFGLTPVFLDNDLALLDRLGRYLEARLGRPVELVKRRSDREITVLLLAGRLDAIPSGQGARPHRVFR